jgi:hypothetical protein
MLTQIYGYVTELVPSALGSIQPPVQWVPRVLSPEVKRLGPEAERSSPSSQEWWSYTSIPLCLHGIGLK